MAEQRILGLKRSSFQKKKKKSGQRGTNQLVSQAAFPTMMYQVSSEGGTTTGSNGQRDGCNVVN